MVFLQWSFTVFCIELFISKYCHNTFSNSCPPETQSNALSWSEVWSQNIRNTHTLGNKQK